MVNQKRVCLLTGAAGTLGSAFCRLHADKYHIVAVHRSRPPRVASQNQQFVDPLRPEAALCENEHKVFTIQADLADDRELARIVDLALARYGRIDLLVNAAVHYAFGAIVDGGDLLESISPQFHINVIVPLKLAATVARKFWRDRDIENRRANRNVVNVSSTSGLYAYSDLGQSVYGTTKAALNFLTKHMALEFSTFGVRVNATAPSSFPESVSTEDVTNSIVRLDTQKMNGKVLVLNEGGERLLSS
jgi:NAD(P)-dependent dehydrogenase (short-subunit alcohol dehydrogenase family)